MRQTDEGRADRRPEPQPADGAGGAVWADNETDIDLLGFDFLVDELLALIHDPAIFPVTIGVTGDWGSGKSSVLKMSSAALGDDDAFIVVSFSPWQFEGYEDVKSALMGTVMDGLRDAIVRDETTVQKTRTLLARLIKRVNLFAAARLVAKSAITAHAGVPIEPTSLASDAIDLIRPEEEDGEREPALDSVADFRRDFAKLLGELDKVRALVVFVDDLDRCLPDTIIETFEAIRLFLHVPKAAYVIAADERIVKGAIQHRYPEAVAEVSNLKQDYLEKLVQMKLVLPPLAAPEAESYINLLLAQGVSTPEDFDKLRGAAAEQRKSAYLGISMNHAIAARVLGGLVSESLTEAFQVAEQIAPILARQLRGNPRQLKRFLNTLTLRRGAAQRRGVELNLAVLAKLMVLEEVDLASFGLVFRWQAEQDGLPAELARAEALAEGGKANEEDEELVKWVSGAQVAEWLRLEPKLAGVNLAPYFFFARERLALSVPASRLTPEQQRLLGDLDGRAKATRSVAVKEALAATAEERGAVFAALLERVVRTPDTPGAESAIEIAAGDTSLVPELAKALNRIPVAAVRPNLPMSLAIYFKPLPPAIDAVAARWATQASTLLGKAAERARKPKDDR
jgi:hypothetical protein